MTDIEMSFKKVVNRHIVYPDLSKAGDTFARLQQGSERLRPAPCTLLQASVGKQDPQGTVSGKHVTTPFPLSHYDWLQREDNRRGGCS